MSDSINHLAEAVEFPVRLLNGEDATMRASRLHRDKYNLENGLFKVVELVNKPKYCIIYEDGKGNLYGDEKPDGEPRDGKSLAALLTGRPCSYHYRDNDPLNNVTLNFESKRNES